jgi:hypothetical protein
VAFEGCGRSNRLAPGAESYDEVDAVMDPLGARPRSLEPIVEVVEAEFEDLIRRLEEGVMSVAFGLDAKQRAHAAAETREWAASTFGDLNQRRLLEVVHTWRAYDLTA